MLYWNPHWFLCYHIDCVLHTCCSHHCHTRYFHENIIVSINFCNYSLMHYCLNNNNEQFKGLKSTSSFTILVHQRPFLLTFDILCIYFLLFTHLLSTIYNFIGADASEAGVSGLTFVYLLFLLGSFQYALMQVSELLSIVCIKSN